MSLGLEPEKRRRLLAQLAADPELRELFASDNLDDRQAVLRRAAVPRWVDATLYEDVVVPDAGSDMPFETFAALPEVDRMPGAQGRYAIRESARPALLTDWSAADLAVFARRLVGPFAMRGASEFEILDLEFRFDPTAAAARFRRLYNTADSRADFPACHSLILLLNTHQGSVQEAIRLYKEFEPLHRLRGRHLQAFYQTARYFARHTVQRTLRDFFRKPDSKWVLHLHGPGGMGKTMLISWLISRRLIRRRVAIPCARFDCDHSSLPALKDYPWLLILTFSEQFDPLLGDRLRNLAISYSPFQALIRPTASSLDAEAYAKLVASAPPSEVGWKQLVDNLRGVPRGKPLVLFVDTLEDAALHQPDAVMAVLRRLVELHEAAPGLRLILSGRYALGRERLPEAAALFGDSIEYAELTRFQQGESKAFFQTLAPQANDVVADAAATRSRGNPFVLNLIAELAVDDPSLDEKKILDPDFDVTLSYLIERVVLRIPASQQLPVRWVIRYGVTTRVLTEDYIGEVLLPFLERGLSGDLARTGDDKIDDYLLKNPWPEGQAIPKAGVIWGQLASYASSHGWVSMAEGEQRAVRFHSDVTDPMRQILRKQPVYQLLQEASAKWFLERGQWADYLYHRLQMNPAGVLADCKAAFASADVREHPAVQLMLAAELLRPDFAGASDDFQAFVHWKKAEALLAQRGYCLFLAPSELSPITVQLEEARQKSAQPTAPAEVWTCLEAVRIHDTAGAQAALDWLAKAPDSVITGAHAAELEWRLGRESAIATIGKAALTAERLGAGSLVPAWALYDKQSDWCARLALWPAAHAACVSAIRTAGPLTRRFERKLFELELAMGRQHQASLLLQKMEGIGPSDEPKDVGLFDLYARLYNQLLRPVTGLDFALSASVDGDAAVAEKQFLTAEAMRQQLQFTSAADRYTESQNEFEKAGLRDGIERGTLSKACMFAFDAGNLMDAQACLVNLPPPTDALPTRQAERALIAAYLASESAPAEAQKLLLGAETAIPKAYRAVRPYLMLTRLTLLDFPWTREEWESLCAEIVAIEPVSARIPLLEILESGGPWPETPADIQDRLLQLFSIDGEDFQERQLFALRRAELLRCLRRPEEAAALLALRIPKPTGLSVDNHLVYRLRLQAELRLLEAGHTIKETPDFETSLEAFRRLTFLSGAFRVEMADRALWHDRRELALKLLEEAEPLLCQETAHTRYDARMAQLQAELSGTGSEEAKNLWGLLGRVGMPPAPRKPALPQQAPPQAAAAEAAGHEPASEELDMLGGLQDGEAPGKVLLNIAIIRHRDEGYRMYEPGRTTGKVPFADFPEAERLKTDRIPGWLYWQMAENWQSVVARLQNVVEMTTLAGAAGDPPGLRRLWLDVDSELLSLPWGFLRHATHHGSENSYQAPAFCDMGSGAGLISRTWGQMGFVLQISTWSAKIRGPEAGGFWTKEVSSVDGLLKSRSMLRSRIPKDPPTILLAMPDTGSNRGEYRGLPEQLRSSGLPYYFTSDLRPEALRGAVQKYRPEVLWLAGGVIDSPSLPQPVLEAGRIRPEDLARLCAQSEPRPGQKLALIMDVPLPESRTDAAQVFGARNRFAAELFRSNQFGCVLATGMCRWEELTVLHKTVIDCLREFRGQDETADEIRAIPNKMTMDGRMEFRDWVPYLGACLFSNNPFNLIVPRLPGDAAP